MIGNLHKAFCSVSKPQICDIVLFRYIYEYQPSLPSSALYVLFIGQRERLHDRKLAQGLFSSSRRAASRLPRHRSKWIPVRIYIYIYIHIYIYICMCVCVCVCVCVYIYMCVCVCVRVDPLGLRAPSSASSAQMVSREKLV